MADRSRNLSDETRRWLTMQLLLAVGAAIGGVLVAFIVAVISESSREVLIDVPSIVPTRGTPTARVTAVSRPSTLSLRTVLDERFAAREGNWPNDPESTAWLAEGAYHLFAREPGRFVAVGAPSSVPFRDVIVTALLRKVGGPSGGGYGLIVHDEGPGPRDGMNQGGRYYVLGTGDRGDIGIWRRAHDHWVDLVSWTPSEAVRPGDLTNELTAWASGQDLNFLVNGVHVATVTDQIGTQGRVGVFVGGDFNEVVLEQLTVQVPTYP